MREHGSSGKLCFGGAPTMTSSNCCRSTADNQPRFIESSICAWKRCLTQRSTAWDFVNRSTPHILQQCAAQ